MGLLRAILNPTLKPVLRALVDNGNRTVVVIQSSDGKLIQSSDSKIVAVQ